MNQFRIKRIPTTLTVVVASNTTTVSSAIGINGMLRGIIVSPPALDSSATLTITIKDTDGYTIYTKATIAANATTPLFLDASNNPLELPLSGNHTITLITSAAQATDKAIPTVLLVQT